MISISDLHVYHGSAHALRGIDLAISEQRFTALIGPNGSGKSTLLGAMAGIVRAESGTVAVQTRDVSSYSRREFARLVSFLPQKMHIPAGLSVRELLVQGRFPWRNWLGGWSTSDEQAVHRAAELCQIEILLDRPLSSLSGGQAQRAWIAMTLAQDAEVILLDEPTTYLDVANQLGLLDLLSILRDAGRTVVAILHDLNQAARYADELVMMRDGLVVAQGQTPRIFNDRNIEKVFGIRSKMLTDAETGDVFCIPSSLSK
ncbi:iron complex transport system ATP-binding protein [Phyllobacterium ifriqiyense]|uniref:Iron complex transport system ATP-binding protein n=1 Tax=Phyllobacterium ifriqiyense TaxID=314238 RepID=A0ABU0S5S9_9HYPH|nr:ABC transporter ATP-binding protein [Phyllobacterium ifriqiyense]MDQ0996118.1 iron complex transport system ATP-binding protein [Phyllobacterium ifriqiyense]